MKTFLVDQHFLTVQTLDTNMLPSALVSGSEIAKQSWRVYVGTLSNSAFGIGCIIMSAMAQHWRKWRPLQIAFSIGLIPCVFSTLFMPKSPRYCKTVESGTDTFGCHQ